MNSIWIALAFFIVGIVVYALGFLIFEGILYNKFGPLARPLIIANGLITLLPPVLWIVALLPPLNDPENPRVLGVGGSPYGLEYEYYPAVAARFVSTAWASLLAAILCSAIMSSRKFCRMRDLAAGVRAINMGPVARLLCCIGAVLFVVYFGAVGWDKLWYSDIGRFDLEMHGQMLMDLRLMNVMWIFIGVCLAVLAAIPGCAAPSMLGLVFILVPVLSISSRATSVICAVLAASLFARLSRKLRVIAFVPLVLFTAAGLWLPLKMREIYATGIGVAYKVLLPAQKDIGGADSGDLLVALGQNIGQGFPVAVEGYQQEAMGQPILSSVPAMYKILSLSPVPSVIDGFADRYFGFREMVNYFTPFNAIAELSAISPIAPHLWGAFCLLLMLVLGRFVWGLSIIRIAGSVTLMVGFVASLIYGQQYLLRQSSRYVFYTAEIVAILLLIRHSIEQRAGYLMRINRMLRARQVQPTKALAKEARTLHANY